jgi:hypothetical protein
LYLRRDTDVGENQVKTRELRRNEPRLNFCLADGPG